MFDGNAALKLPDDHHPEPLPPEPVKSPPKLRPRFNLVADYLSALIRRDKKSHAVTARSHRITCDKLSRIATLFGGYKDVERSLSIQRKARGYSLSETRLIDLVYFIVNGPAYQEAIEILLRHRLRCARERMVEAMKPQPPPDDWSI